MDDSIRTASSGTSTEDWATDVLPGDNSDCYIGISGLLLSNV
jgi:hypothetical protein